MVVAEGEKTSISFFGITVREQANGAQTPFARAGMWAQHEGNDSGRQSGGQSRGTLFSLLHTHPRDRHREKRGGHMELIEELNDLAH